MPGLPPCPRRGSPGRGCRRSPAAVWARGARLSPGRPRPPLISIRLASISSACTFLPPHSSGLTLPALPPPGWARRARAVDPAQKTSGEGARGAGRRAGGRSGGKSGKGAPPASKGALPAARRGSAGVGVGNNHLRRTAASRARLPAAGAPAPSGPGRLRAPATSPQPFWAAGGAQEPSAATTAPSAAESGAKGLQSSGRGCGTPA